MTQVADPIQVSPETARRVEAGHEVGDLAGADHPDSIFIPSEVRRWSEAVAHTRKPRSQHDGPRQSRSAGAHP